jgi:DNA-directed RNA polymerase subunit M/transcription elongation factor TFIIS
MSTKEEIYSIDNFSYENEYLKHCDFIMENSLHLSIDFIKQAETQINRKENVQTIDKIINCINISEDIEKGIFEFSLNYVKTHGYPDHFFQLTYNNKLHDLLVNLDINNKKIENKTLLPNILSAKLSGQIIAFLNMYQLHPIRWKSIIDKNNLRDDTMATVNTTDEYKCGRCGERKHIYYITQTRCIDEPATIFYTCTVCRKTFTKSM